MKEKPEEIRCVRKEDPDYPGRLKELPDMPGCLYVLGDLPGEEPSAAIVGARMCSPYGEEQAFRFGKALAANGVQVISGMALGIDGYAQEGALAGGGRTFAVLGCGADVCYPRAHAELYRQIRRTGGILSEALPGEDPKPWYFPRRNRIISGLSDLVLVIEARQKSGSLITVSLGLEQGRSVYAVPGRIGDALSDGCNALIAQGAGIAVSPEAVLSEITELSYRKGRRKPRSAAREESADQISARGPGEGTETGPAGLRDPAGPEEGLILPLLGRDPRTADELYAEQTVRAAGMTLPALNACLVRLVLRGEVRETGRGHFIRNFLRI